MAIKYYVCGDTNLRFNSHKTKNKCATIEAFMSAGDDDTVRAIKDLCANIVDMDEITRDKLKGNNLALEVKTKALAFRKVNPPNPAGG